MKDPGQDKRVSINDLKNMFLIASSQRYSLDYDVIRGMLEVAAMARQVFNIYGRMPMFTDDQAHEFVALRVQRCDDPLEACCEFVEALHNFYVARFRPAWM